MLFALSTWFNDWLIVREVLKSPRLLLKAKGRRVFSTGSLWAQGTRLYIGRIKEIESA
jgi:hypothetical protein